MISDPAAGDIITFQFNTDSLGSLVTITSPVVGIYKAGSTTASSVGVTITPDYSGRQGLNNVAIDTSTDGTFYANGADYDVFIISGTVDGAPWAGRLLKHFHLAAAGGGGSPSVNPGAAAKIYRYVSGGHNQAVMFKGDADRPVFAVDFSAGCRGGNAISASVEGTDSAGNVSTNIVSTGIVTSGRMAFVRLNTGGAGGSGDAVDGSRFRVRVTATGADASILQFDVFVLIRSFTYNPL